MTESVDDFVAAFEKVNRVAKAKGDSSVDSLLPVSNSESLIHYRQRLASKYKAHSTQFKDVDLFKIGCPNALTAVEDAIFKDAMNPSSFRPGELRRVAARDASGREISHYVGDPNACWDQFNPPIRYVRRFNTAGAPR